MAFQIPSLGELAERARRAFRANLPGTDAFLWPNNVNVTGKVFAGLVHLVFGFADYVAKQRFALTADSDNLDKHGEELGLARKPAGPSRGMVTISTDAGPVTVEIGALFRRLDGAEFRAVNADGIEGSGSFDVEVVSVLESAASVALPGTGLEIISGVTGDALAEVGSDGIAGGTDIEGDEEFRERILFRKRNPPHGGSVSDYLMWMTQVPGVTRGFVEPLHAGGCTVRVFPLMDDLYANGIAPSGEIARVRDYIESVRPAGAIVTVAAPTPVSVDIEITGLTPDTQEVRENVIAELRAAFRRLARVAGIADPLDAQPYRATEFTFSRSWIWQAVANATGEQAHEITAPEADLELSAGQMPVLGDVTFV